MWCDEEIEESDYYTWEPRTPTQLAADYGRLKTVRMLLDRGADINEAPAYRFGRTALQAVASSESPSMELVQFLLEKSADVNAKPAVHGGITALQGAAISGDIMLAKLLLDKGADVNAAPSFIEGRYAIEGAAEHGRLDMVQLLLNAGAMGDVFRGTGFEYAIKLAEKKGHSAIADLLKNVTRVFAV
jgi:ankyrin repeat protein